MCGGGPYLSTEHKFSFEGEIRYAPFPSQEKNPQPIVSEHVCVPEMSFQQ